MKFCCVKLFKSLSKRIRPIDFLLFIFIGVIMYFQVSSFTTTPTPKPAAPIIPSVGVK